MLSVHSRACSAFKGSILFSVAHFLMINNLSVFRKISFEPALKVEKKTVNFNMQCSVLEQWLPYKLITQSDQLLCRWLYLGGKRFTEPFFDETIMKCLSLPYNSKFLKSVSDLQVLKEWSLQMDNLHPTAFIFHISRCGSTLVSQLFSLFPQNIVLSEVPILDELLRLPYKRNALHRDESDALFKATLAFYGQRRESVHQNLFIKTDSWHILFYDRLRRLFPGVPFVLLYRTPEEVMLSHHRKRGIHAVPGLIEAGIFGFDDAGFVNLDVYLAAVLEKYLTTYLQIIQKDKNVLLLNYGEGIMNMMEKIADKANLIFSPKEWDTMEERATFDAKYPGQKFSEDQSSLAKPEYLHSCSTLYEQLEQFRKAQSCFIGTAFD